MSYEDTDRNVSLFLTYTNVMLNRKRIREIFDLSIINCMFIIGFPRLSKKS